MSLGVICVSWVWVTCWLLLLVPVWSDGRQLMHPGEDTEGLSCTETRERLSIRVMQCFMTGARTKSLSEPSRLLETCIANAGQRVQSLTGLVPTEAEPLLSPFIATYERQSGFRLHPTYRPLFEIADELRFNFVRNVTSFYSIFAASSTYIDELHYMGVLQDMTPLMNAAESTGPYKVMLDKIHPFYMQNIAMRQNKVLTFPIITSLVYMYWRTDVFAKYKLAVPQTWEEVIEVVRFLNRTNWDTRVKQKVSICFPKPLIKDMGGQNQGYFLLTAILGSMVMYQGKPQGLLYDPLTMTPLVNNTAMAKALGIYRQLAAFMPDKFPGPPYDPFWQPMIANGYCAIGFRWTEQFKAMSTSMYWKGKIGISNLPGSTQVWDRVHQVMVNCTPSLCLGSDSIVRKDPVTGENVTLWVNRVNYPGRWSYGPAVNALAIPAYKEAAYQICSYMGMSFINNPTLAFNPIAPIGPVQIEQLKYTPEALEKWPSIYNRTDILSYLHATENILDHPNTMTDLRMANQGEIMTVMDDAARSIEQWGDAYVTTVMSKTQRRLLDILAGYDLGGPSGFRDIYWAGIGFSPFSGPVDEPTVIDIVVPSGDSNTRYSTSVMPVRYVIAISVCMAIGVIGLFVGAIILLRRCGLHRTMMGHVIMPGLGPTTTLLVTDVQASTILWDSLPQDVMESSMALHFAVLRRVAMENTGHESATEGDSIILGFRTPSDAISAATQAQSQLLSANWPPQLLAHELCAPRYMVSADPMSLQPEAGCPAFPFWAGLQSKAPVSGCSTVDNRKLTIFQRAVNAMGKRGRAAKRDQIETDPIKAAVMRSSVVDAKALTDCNDVQEYLLSLVTLAPGPTNMASASLFRGLRVRIGLHTGVFGSESIIQDVRTGKMQYTGHPLEMATAVASAGYGGMVLLSGDTFNQLNGTALAARGTLLASMGCYKLPEIDGQVEIYQALSEQFAYRSALGVGIRCTRRLSPSFLHAPHGQITVSYMHVVGLAALNAWSSIITQGSVELYQSIAISQLNLHDGYLVNTSDGLFLTAFNNPAQAIRWALTTLHLCREADWAPDLLEHELGEEVAVGRNVREVTEVPHSPAVYPRQESITCGSVPNSQLLVKFGGDSVFFCNEFEDGSPASMVARMPSKRVGSSLSGPSNAVQTITKKSVLFRGLRLKCAVDLGYAKASIEPSTGRIMYFGRVMNRCARLSAATKTGQVWCTEDVWAAAEPSLNPGLDGASTGLIRASRPSPDDGLRAFSNTRSSDRSKPSGVSKLVPAHAMQAPSEGRSSNINRSWTEATNLGHTASYGFNAIVINSQIPEHHDAEEQEDALEDYLLSGWPSIANRVPKGSQSGVPGPSTQHGVFGGSPREAGPSDNPLTMTFASGQQTASQGSGSQVGNRLSPRGANMRSTPVHCPDFHVLGARSHSCIMRHGGGSSVVGPKSPQIVSLPPSQLTVAGRPLGSRTMAGIQESVSIIQCYFND